MALLAENRDDMVLKMLMSMIVGKINENLWHAQCIFFWNPSGDKWGLNDSGICLFFDEREVFCFGGPKKEWECVGLAGAIEYGWHLGRGWASKNKWFSKIQIDKVEAKRCFKRLAGILVEQRKREQLESEANAIRRREEGEAWKRKVESGRKRRRIVGFLFYAAISLFLVCTIIAVFSKWVK